MKRTVSFFLKMIGAVAWLGAATLGYSETITHTVSGKQEFWHIDSPIVNSPGWRNYAGQIVFQPYDTVIFYAGGCVQTGGHGLTWKRYVDPQGPNSGTLYHGSLAMPGVDPNFMQSVLSPVSAGSDVYVGQFNVGDEYLLQDTLWLTYVDDSYSDNGYYSHDNGTGNQCENVGNAWIDLIINHQ